MPTIAETSKEKRLISELFSGGDVKSKKQRVRFDDHVEVLTSSDDDDEEEEEDDDEVEFTLTLGEDGDLDYTIVTSASSSSSSFQPSREDVKVKEVSSQDHHLHHKIVPRPASPFAGSDRRLCEELYMSPSFHYGGGGDYSDYPPAMSSFNCYSPSRSSACWSSSLGNNLKILVTSSSSSISDSTIDQDDDDSIDDVANLFASKGGQSPPLPHNDDSAMLTPLITPPSSPRREVCNIPSDGQVAEGEAVVICEWPCNLTVDNAITSALELPPLDL
jgi:hypothetical protein